MVDSSKPGSRIGADGVQVRAARMIGAGEPFLMEEQSERLFW